MKVTASIKKGLVLAVDENSPVFCSDGTEVLTVVGQQDDKEPETPPPGAGETYRLWGNMLVVGAHAQ